MTPSDLFPHARPRALVERPGGVLSGIERVNGFGEALIDG